MTAIYIRDQKISYVQLLQWIEKRTVVDPIFPVTRTLDCVLNILTCWIKGIPFFPYSPLLLKKPSVTFNPGSDLILHSSGSFQMKYIQLTKKGFIESIINTHKAFILEEDDVYLLNLPLYHVAGIAILLRAFLRGGSIAIEPNDPSIITHLSMVPSQTEILKEKNPFPHLKALLLGGSKIPTDLADFLVDNHYPLYVTYGMTETYSHVFVEKYQKGEGVFFRQPLKGRKVFINDQGILFVKLFCMNEFYNTKDRFSFKEGKYRYIEREDAMFISGGENIYPEEITQALFKIPGIKKVDIEIKEDLKWGNRPFVTIYTDKPTSLSSIKGSLALLLEKFKIPKDHEIALYSLDPF
jgi:O-succinylbenzoic acid--CoA ligase